MRYTYVYTVYVYTVYVYINVYLKEGSFGGGNVGESGKLPMIRQTKTIQIYI